MLSGQPFSVGLGDGPGSLTLQKRAGAGCPWIRPQGWPRGTGLQRPLVGSLGTAPAGAFAADLGLRGPRPLPPHLAFVTTFWTNASATLTASQELTEEEGVCGPHHLPRRPPRGSMEGHCPRLQWEGGVLRAVTSRSAGRTRAAPPARLSEALGSAPAPAAQLGVSPCCVLSPYLFASSGQIKRPGHRKDDQGRQHGFLEEKELLFGY